MLTKRRQRSLIDRWKTRGLQKRGQTPSPNPSLMGRISSNPSTQGYLKQDGVRSHSFPKLNPSSQTYSWKDRVAATPETRDTERSNNMTVSKYANPMDESQPKSNILRKRSSHIQDTGCQTDAEILGMLLAFLRNHIGGISDAESGEKSFFSGLNDKMVTFSTNDAICNQESMSTNRHYSITPLPLSESPKGACIDCIPGNTLASEKSPLLSADDDADTLSLGDTNLESGKEFSFSSSLREFPFMLKRRPKVKHAHNESDVSEMSWMAQSSGQESIQSTPDNCLFPSVSESPNLLNAADRKSVLTPQSSYESRDNDKSCNGYEPLVVTVSVTPSTSVAAAAAAAATLAAGMSTGVRETTAKVGGGAAALDKPLHTIPHASSSSVSSSSTATAAAAAAVAGNVANTNAAIAPNVPITTTTLTTTPNTTTATSTTVVTTSNAVSSLAVAALNRMSRDNDAARRCSALSWSSSSGNVSLRKSLEEMSMHGLSALDDEEISMEKFIDYLKMKGIKFDESSLQSSDV